MKLLLKNNLIISLLVAITLALAFKQTSPSTPPPVIAKQPNKSQNKQAVIRQTITPKPNASAQLKNPFKPLGDTHAPTEPSTTTKFILTGILSQDNDFLAIISANGKTDFYKPQQKIANYLLTEINSTSVVLYDQQSNKQLILHIKED